MAVTSVRVGKSGSRSTPIKLIVGDSNSQVVRIIVPRHFGGVDLGALAWAVEVRNANGATDIYYIYDKQTDPDVIELFWKLTGTATSAVGVTEFQVQGLEDDTGAGPVIWQSGVYCMQILPDEIEHVPGSEEQQALTALQGLIVYVEGELNTVLAARDAANTAAENADGAATEARQAAYAATDAKTGAEAAATGANNAAQAADAAAANANNAAGGANAAAKQALTSAANADTAVRNADNAANTALSAARSAVQEVQGIETLKNQTIEARNSANAAAERANANADAVTEAIAQTEAAKQTAIDAADNADNAAANANNAAQAADAAAANANAAAETATEAAKDAPIMITMSADCASIDGEITITDVSMPPTEIQKTFGSGKHFRAALTISINGSSFNKYMGYVDLCQGFMVIGSNPKNLLQWTGVVNRVSSSGVSNESYRVAVDLNIVDSPIGGTIKAFRIANNADVEGVKTRLTTAETNIKGIDARVTKIEEEGAGGGSSGGSSGGTSGAVTSVNGKTGAVVLDAKDVGADTVIISIIAVLSDAEYGTLENVEMSNTLELSEQGIYTVADIEKLLDNGRNVVADVQLNLYKVVNGNETGGTFAGQLQAVKWLYMGEIGFVGSIANVTPTAYAKRTLRHVWIKLTDSDEPGDFKIRATISVHAFATTEDKLKNPQPIFIYTPAGLVSYDGGEFKTITIPEKTTSLPWSAITDPPFYYQEGRRSIIRKAAAYLLKRTLNLQTVWHTYSTHLRLLRTNRTS